MLKKWNRQTFKRCMITTFLVLFTVMQTAQAASRYVFIHSDMLGSPMATTDERGNIISRENVTPYGDSLGKRDSTNSVAVGSPEHGRGYTGHVRDKDLGLTYMQARYYDPTIGRFLGADPVGFLDNGRPEHFNRYTYAYNNPYSYTDPNGKWGLALGGQGNANVLSIGVSAELGGYFNIDSSGIQFGGYGSLEGGPTGGAFGWGAGVAATAYSSDVGKAVEGYYNETGVDVGKVSVGVVTTIPVDDTLESVSGVQVSYDRIGGSSYGLHSRYGKRGRVEFGSFTWGDILSGITSALGLGGDDNNGSDDWDSETSETPKSAPNVDQPTGTERF